MKFFTKMVDIYNEVFGRNIIRDLPPPARKALKRPRDFPLLALRNKRPTVDIGGCPDYLRRHGLPQAKHPDQIVQRLQELEQFGTERAVYIGLLSNIGARSINRVIEGLEVFERLLSDRRSKARAYGDLRDLHNYLLPHLRYKVFMDYYIATERLASNLAGAELDVGHCLVCGSFISMFALAEGILAGNAHEAPRQLKEVNAYFRIPGTEENGGGEREFIYRNQDGAKLMPRAKLAQDDLVISQPEDLLISSAFSFIALALAFKVDDQVQPYKRDDQSEMAPPLAERLLKEVETMHRINPWLSMPYNLAYFIHRARFNIDKQQLYGDWRQAVNVLPFRGDAPVLA